MSYSDNGSIYTISEYQLTNLSIAANSEIPGFAVVGATETDDEATKEKLSRYQSEAEDLVRLGLAEEITEQFKAAITDKELKFDRKLRVYAVTEVGFLMFHDHGDRPAN